MIASSLLVEDYAKRIIAHLQYESLSFRELVVVNQTIRHDLVFTQLKFSLLRFERVIAIDSRESVEQSDAKKNQSFKDSNRQFKHH